MAVALISAQSFGGLTSVNLVSGNADVVIFCFQSAFDSTTPPTFNGVALTLWGQLASAGAGIFLFYMVNPPNGAHNFVPNGFNACNVYAMSGVAATFTDVYVNDTADVGNTGVPLTPTIAGGYLLFFQQARSGSGAQAQTAGQTNVLGLQFGATMAHTTPGAGVTYTSTVTYAPSFGPYDQFGIALFPASSTTTSTTITTSSTTTTTTSTSTSITTTSSSTTTTSSSSTSTLSTSSSISTSSSTSSTLSTTTTLTPTSGRGTSETKTKVFINKTREH